MAQLQQRKILGSFPISPTDAPLALVIFTRTRPQKIFLTKESNVVAEEKMSRPVSMNKLSLCLTDEKNDSVQKTAFGNTGANIYGRNGEF